MYMLFHLLVVYFSLLLSILPSCEEIIRSEYTCCIQSLTGNTREEHNFSSNTGVDPKGTADGDDQQTLHLIRDCFLKQKLSGVFPSLPWSTTWAKGIYFSIFEKVVDPSFSGASLS